MCSPNRDILFSYLWLGDLSNLSNQSFYLEAEDLKAELFNLGRCIYASEYRLMLAVF